MENKNIYVSLSEHFEQPIVKENKRDEWVEYGEDNNYYQWLIDRYTYSPTNHAIINNIVKLVYGKGLSALDASSKPQQYAQMVSLISQDCVKQLITDYKMLGQCAIQIIYNKDRSAIAEATHIPIQLLRMEKCNEDGDIEAVWYSDDWENIKDYAPRRIPLFTTSNESIEILYVQRYSVGRKYYSQVDYQGAIGYALLEEEISNYLINEVQNGFSGTKIINFNNGIPSPEERELIKNETISKVTGSRGQRTIVAFNHSEANKTTIDDVPLNDAPNHYEYLSDECMRKLMLGHNVTSPLLFGVASSNGFSSNADELKNSFILYYNMVIKPMQEVILDAINQVLTYNDLNLKLYFETLKPLEFTNPDGTPIQEDTERSRFAKVDDPIENVVLKNVIEEMGHTPHPQWLLLDEYEVDYENDDDENILLHSEAPKKSKLSKILNLVSTGTADPNDPSKQDAIIDGIQFITRYVYAGETDSNSREFCRAMIDAKKIYRKEDILNMQSYPVNPGWGPKGADKYNIWMYKGGGLCRHMWWKQVYVSFEGTDIDVNSPTAKRIAGRKAERYGYVVKNPEGVSTPPRDMPNKGFLPSNKKYS